MRLPRWPAVRDAVLWCAGMALLTHETLVVTAPRWELLVVATAMIGLPGILRADFALVKPPSPSGPSESPSSPPDSPATP